MLLINSMELKELPHCPHITYNKFSPQIEMSLLLGFLTQGGLLEYLAIVDEEEGKKYQETPHCR